MDWYLKVLRQYADFEGRARRKEYWMFILFNTIFFVSAIILDNVLGITFNHDVPVGPFYTLYVIAIFIPGLAVSVRRLHDIGKSGWYYLIVFIPLAGSFWFLILVATDSDRGENEYGVSPKFVNSEALDTFKTGTSAYIPSSETINQDVSHSITHDDKQELPNAIGVLILGIFSILLCSTVILGIVCGIIALVISKKAKLLLEENPDGYSKTGFIKVGRTTAIIGIILSVLYIPMVLLIVSMDY